MNPIAIRHSTSSTMAAYFSVMNDLLFWQTFLQVGSTHSRCSIIVLSIPAYHPGSMRTHLYFQSNNASRPLQCLEGVLCPPVLLYLVSLSIVLQILMVHSHILVVGYVLLTPPHYSRGELVVWGRGVAYYECGLRLCKH